MNLGTLSAPRKAVLALALAVGLVTGIAAKEVYDMKNPPATLKLADPREGSLKNTFAPVVKRALPAVVNISTSKVVKAPTSMRGGRGGAPMDPFREFFGEDFGGQFQAPKDRREQSLGSGVIISPEGYILTNNHVVDGATDINVTLSDRREFKARLVGGDSRSDVALLKIEGAGTLPVITIADSTKVEVGDWVLAIGNPFGVGQTVTMGIVSATKRGNLGIEEYEDFIQTDAAINPGNSGGALVNERGELIGINTAILSRAGGNQGIGFAIPANMARDVMEQLRRSGKVVRAYMGIIPQDLTPTMAKAFGAKDLHGALVGDVTPDSPAAKAGLQKGDIITEVNGKTVETANQLRNSIALMPPDQAVSLKVWRDGNARNLSVTLAEFPTEQQRASNDTRDDNTELSGVRVEDIDAQTRRQLNLKPGTQGVVVTEISSSSPAADSGLRVGDVIQEVNRKPVRSAADFQRAMRQAGEVPLLLVNRRGNTLFIAV
ncbi:MAG: DegQ family serine endoprotease [Bryobacterales bacterium]|nr:DegQ family serine endoprotease [Bryobacterales bacterium]